jgi:tripartite-type tricarboxylate transporter receptor subunit TctC
LASPGSAGRIGGGICEDTSSFHPGFATFNSNEEASMRTIGRGFGIAALTSLMLMTATAWGQTFPNKPVTMLVGLGAGGNASAIARALGEHLSKKWNQPVVVDFKPGAGGYIASDMVAKAPPDGYTLLFMESAVTTFSLFSKNMQFNPAKDVAPVTMVATLAALLYTNSKVPARTFEEFVTYAKANPGKLNFGVLGPSGQLLDILKVNSAAGIRMEEISYKGVGDVMQALFANDLQLYASGVANMLPHVQAGTIVPLVVMGEKRVKEFPNVPTLREVGIDHVSAFWYGLFAPPGTPKSVVEKIAADVNELLRSPSFQTFLESRSLEGVGSTPDQFAKALEDEIRVKTGIAKGANIQPK